MKFITITPLQLLLLSVSVAMIAAAAVTAVKMWYDWKLLPEVVLDKNMQCVKVLNYENGHAFTCPDVDVLLRRYRSTEIPE